MDINDDLNSSYQSFNEKLILLGYEVGDLQKIDYGIQFSIKKNNWSGVVRVYKNKKGIISFDYSQLRSDEHLGVLFSIQESSTKDYKTEKSSATNYTYPLIGTDESGKGDYFGPLVSAGVFLDLEMANKLTKIGVKDSKELSDDKNKELAKVILEVCCEKYSIVEISPQKYNELYGKFKAENQNLNSLLAWGHAKAIEEILGKVKCEIVISDQFADEKFILSKLQEKGRKVKLVQMHKAEQNVVVAAASIIARARFLTKLSTMSEQYKMEFPKGASVSVIESARLFVKKYGKESLIDVAKIHFKTTKEVLG